MDSPDSTPAVRYGYFLRKFDRKKIRRFKCLKCRQTFSRSTGSATFNQKKAFINETLFSYFASQVSKNRCARLLQVYRITIARRLAFLGHQSRVEHQRWLDKFQEKRAFNTIQFDEIESLEHTKLKPLSIPLLVEVTERKILGIDVCVMPAKGHTASLSVKKYGKRPDQRIETLKRLFETVRPPIQPDAELRSDSHPFYPSIVREMMPKALHFQEISRRSSLGGQGESNGSQNLVHHEKTKCTHRSSLDLCALP